MQQRYPKLPCEETSPLHNLVSVISAPAQLLKRIVISQSSSAPVAVLPVAAPHAHTLPVILVPLA